MLRAWEMVQYVKCMLLKLESPSLDPQTHLKLGTTSLAYNPSPRKAETG